MFPPLRDSHSCSAVAQRVPSSPADMKSTGAIANTEATLSSTAPRRTTQRIVWRRSVLLRARTYLFLAFLLGGCGYAGTPPNNNVTVTVQPSTANVALGQSQQFQATVTNSSNGAVSWNVNGVAGGNSTSGTVSPSGLYTAPATMPNPATVTVTAISQADPQASGSSAVTLLQQSSIAVSVAPQTASVPTGGAQVFAPRLSQAPPHPASLGASTESPAATARSAPSSRTTPAARSTQRPF